MSDYTVNAMQMLSIILLETLSLDVFVNLSITDLLVIGLLSVSEWGP